MLVCLAAFLFEAFVVLLVVRDVLRCYDFLFSIAWCARKRVSAGATFAQAIDFHLLLVLHIDRDVITQERFAHSYTFIDISLNLLELTLTECWPYDVLLNYGT